MKKPQYLLMILCLSVLLFLFAGCSSNVQSQNMQEEIAMLRTRIDSLQNEIARMTADQTELAEKVMSLETMQKHLQTLIPNRYKGIVFVSIIKNYGVYSIEFVETDVIKVYSGKDAYGEESTDYYRVEEYEINTFRIIGDVLYPDSDPGLNFEALQLTWLNEENPKLKVIEVSEDKKDLYYGNHLYYHCVAKK